MFREIGFKLYSNGPFRKFKLTTLWKQCVWHPSKTNWHLWTSSTNIQNQLQTIRKWIIIFEFQFNLKMERIVLNVWWSIGILQHTFISFSSCRIHQQQSSLIIYTINPSYPFFLGIFTFATLLKVSEYIRKSECNIALDQDQKCLQHMHLILNAYVSKDLIKQICNVLEKSLAGKKFEYYDMVFQINQYTSLSNPTEMYYFEHCSICIINVCTYIVITILTFRHNWLNSHRIVHFYISYSSCNIIWIKSKYVSMSGFFWPNY